MKLIVDTNVLVRYLVADDPEQSAASVRILEGGDDIVIPIVVLCEAVWILQRAYKYKREEIERALRLVVESSNAIVDRPAAESGLDLLRRGGDFADGTIAYEVERFRADHLVTFDRTFARLSDPAKVRLIGS